jgi:hypothetical protein
MPDSKDNRELGEQTILKAELENALLKFRADSAERLTAHQALIQEANLYKWLLRCIFSVLGLGTIGGIIALFNLNTYLDQRIAAQLESWQALEGTVELSRDGRWPEAREKLIDIYHHLNNSSSEYRSLLFRTLFRVLASIAEPQSDEETWVGETDWNELKDNQTFKREVIEQQSKRDESYYNQIFLCTLKFAKENSLELMRKYRTGALDTVGEIRSKAAHYFDLGMIDLLVPDQAGAESQVDEACSNLDKAFKIDPEHFTFDTSANLDKYFGSFKNRLDYQMWHRCAKRLGANVNFDSRLQSLITSMKSKLGSLPQPKSQ